MGRTQNSLSRFDQQTTQVFAPVAGDAAGSFAFAAVIKARIEANVFDQFEGFGKAVDIADECTQGKGHHFPGNQSLRLRSWAGASVPLASRTSWSLR